MTGNMREPDPEGRSDGYRLDPVAQRAWERAERIAEGWRTAIGTAHLLDALLAEPTVLARLDGVDVGAMRRALGYRMSVYPQHDDRAVNVVAQAESVGRRLRGVHAAIGVDDLLCALTDRDAPGVGSDVLRAHVSDMPLLHNRLLRAIDSPASHRSLHVPGRGDGIAPGPDLAASARYDHDSPRLLAEGRAFIAHVLGLAAEGRVVAGARATIPPRDGLPPGNITVLSPVDGSPAGGDVFFDSPLGAAVFAGAAKDNEDMVRLLAFQVFTPRLRDDVTQHLVSESFDLKLQAWETPSRARTSVDAGRLASAGKRTTSRAEPPWRLARPDGGRRGPDVGRGL